MKKFAISKSRRLRTTPYTSRIEKQGVTSYTVYNHMLLPTSFGSLENDLSPIIVLEPFDLKSRTGRVLIFAPKDFSKKDVCFIKIL